MNAAKAVRIIIGLLVGMLLLQATTIGVLLIDRGQPPSQPHVAAPLAVRSTESKGTVKELDRGSSITKPAEPMSMTWEEFEALNPPKISAQSASGSKQIIWALLCTGIVTIAIFAGLIRMYSIRKTNSTDQLPTTPSPPDNPLPAPAVDSVNAFEAPCPKCGADLVVPKYAAGKAVRCANCGVINKAKRQRISNWIVFAGVAAFAFALALLTSRGILDAITYIPTILVEILLLAMLFSWFERKAKPNETDLILRHWVSLLASLVIVAGMHGFLAWQNSQLQDLVKGLRK